MGCLLSRFWRNLTALLWRHSVCSWEVGRLAVSLSQVGSSSQNHNALWVDWSSCPYTHPLPIISIQFLLFILLSVLPFHIFIPHLFILSLSTLWIVLVQSAKRFCIIFSAILNNVIWSNKRRLKITYSQRHFIEIMHIFVVISVPADGLAPLGARTSAGTVMTKFGLVIYIWDQHLKGEIINTLTHIHCR